MGEALGWAAPEDSCRFEFHRGFIDEAHLTAQQLLRAADHLFRLAPLRKLKLTRPRLGEGVELVACAGLARVKCLSLDLARIDPEDLFTLFASRHLGALRELAVESDGTCNPIGLRPLLRSPRFAQCTALRIRTRRGWDTWEEIGLRGRYWERAGTPRGWDIGPSSGYYGDVEQNILGAGYGPHLQALDLDMELTGRGAGLLASSPALSGLTSLRIVGVEGYLVVWPLRESPHLGRLGDLDLSACDLGVLGALSLAGWLRLAGLRRLTLVHAGLGADGVRALCESPYLGGLEILDLSGNCEPPDRGPGSGDALAEVLARCPHLGGLRWLILIDSRLGARGTAALAASPFLGGLQRLDLGRNDIPPREARALRDRFGDRVHF